MRVSLRLFADHFQFYLQDEAAEGNLGGSWGKEAVDRLLAVAPGTLGIGTVRNMTVPVTVEVLEAEPLADFAASDLVTEATLEVPSGIIVIAGCTDYFPDAKRIPLAPGRYRARIHYDNLGRLREDGLDGEDRYRVLLWRDDLPVEPRVLHDSRPALAGPRRSPRSTLA